MEVNNLTRAVSIYPETFKECRLYLLQVLKAKEQVIKLEQSKSNLIVADFYIKYLEYKGINFIEAMVYTNFNFPNNPYALLVDFTITTCFKKLEIKDLNFIPF